MSPSSITISGGSIWRRSMMVSWQYFLRREMWKMSWIQSFFRSFNWYTISESLDITWKGPKNLEANFQDAQSLQYFCATIEIYHQFKMLAAMLLCDHNFTWLILLQSKSLSLLLHEPIASSKFGPLLLGLLKSLV